jgi:hypothetical protein
MEEFSFTIVRELSVDLANEVGSFASLTEALAKAQVLIHGISVESGHSVSRVHFVVDNPNAALSILEQEGERVSADIPTRNIGACSSSKRPFLSSTRRMEKGSG